MKKIYIHVKNTCERRKLDGKKIYEYLTKNGHIIAHTPKEADIIIYLGCAAVNETAENALNKVKELQKYDAELIVAGCLPTIEEKRLNKIFNGKTICTKDLEKTERFFPDDKIKFTSIDDQNILYESYGANKTIKTIKNFLRKIGLIEKTYLKIKDYIFKNLFGEKSVISDVLTSRSLYHIRISWGCLGNCTYCAIKEAIGPFHSKPLEQCLNELKKGLKEGHKRFVIIADDVGAYGLDIGSNFAELVDKMTAIPSDYEISIRFLAPRWFIKYINQLDEIIKRHKIRYPYIPIQSGSSRILKLMNRFSDTEKMKEVFLRAKKTYPDIELTTGFIIGFPSETEEEFKETLHFIKKINFRAGIVFPFSLRPNTEAENIEPKIPEKEIFRRMKYAKKFLKKEGYHVIYLSKPKLFFIPKLSFFLFEKRYHNLKTK